LSLTGSSTTAFKLFNPPHRVHIAPLRQLPLIPRMTCRTDFHMQHRFCRACLPSVATRANDGALHIVGVDARFHGSFPPSPACSLSNLCQFANQTVPKPPSKAGTALLSETHRPVPGRKAKAAPTKAHPIASNSQPHRCKGVASPRHAAATYQLATNQQGIADAHSHPLGEIQPTK
jgi:hypothetical protein